MTTVVQQLSNPSWIVCLKRNH